MIDADPTPTTTTDNADPADLLRAIDRAAQASERQGDGGVWLDLTSDLMRQIRAHVATTTGVPS